MVARIRPVRLLAVIGIFVTSPALAAQDRPDAAVSAPCELHVWPSAGLNSVYHGWFHGGIVNGAVTGRDGYPEVRPDPLSSAAQVDLARAASPQTLLDDRPHTLTIHPEALDSRTIRTAKARLTPSTADCYAELIVDDVFFRQDWVNGSFLTTLFRFRKFGAGADPVRTFGTWVKTPVKLTPIKPPTTPQAAEDELQAAYRANFQHFADALRRPPKK